MVLLALVVSILTKTILKTFYVGSRHGFATVVFVSQAQDEAVIVIGNYGLHSC